MPIVCSEIVGQKAIADVMLLDIRGRDLHWVDEQLCSEFRGPIQSIRILEKEKLLRATLTWTACWNDHDAWELFRNFPEATWLMSEKKEFNQTISGELLIDSENNKYEYAILAPGDNLKKPAK